LALRSSKTSYSSGEVKRLTGITPERLSYWRKSGLIEPTGEEPSRDGRPGQTCWWSFADLLAVRAAMRLRGAGVSLQGIRSVVARLRELDNNGRHPLARFRVVTDGVDAFLIRDGDDMESLLKRPGQGVWRVVALADLARDLRAELRRDAVKQRRWGDSSMAAKTG
jgi:DNA-binding transcriptional MerR regulator